MCYCTPIKRDVCCGGPNCFPDHWQSWMGKKREVCKTCNDDMYYFDENDECLLCEDCLPKNRRSAPDFNPVERRKGPSIVVDVTIRSQ